MAYEIKFTIDDDMLPTVVSVLHKHVTAMSIAPAEQPPGDLEPPLFPLKKKQPVHRAKRGTLIDLVLATVRSRKRITHADIYEIVEKRGMHAASVSPALTKLSARGLIVRDSRGRYSAVVEEPAPAAATAAAKIGAGPGIQAAIFKANNG